MTDYFLMGHEGKKVPFRLPAGWQVLTNAVMEAEKTEKPLEQLVREAIASPLGTPPLADLINGKGSVAIIVDDLTRPTPRKALLACLLDFLHDHGIGKDRVDVLIGVGTHRPLSRAEIEDTFGRKMCREVRFTNHDCRAVDLVSVGTLKFGGELLLNPIAVKADLRIALGSLLPHLQNGFGGGAKLVLPGIAGWDTIRRHHVALTTAEGVSLGNLTGNPFHDDITEAGRLGKLDFIINAVYGADEEVKAIVAGDFEKAFTFGARLCEKELGVRFDRAADVTIASAFPYTEGPQIMKPLCPATMVTKKGGVVIIFAPYIRGGRFPASLLDTFGAALTLAAGDTRGLVFDVLGRGKLLAPDAPMDFNSALNTVLLFQSRVKVLLVSKDADEQQAAQLGFGYAGSLDEGIAMVSRTVPEATVNILPSGGLVLPLVAEEMKFTY